MSRAAGHVGDRDVVLVGVGTSSRPSEGYDGAAVEPVELMVEAALAALDDTAGAASALRSSLGLVAVPEGNWGYADPARLVADRLGATVARTVLVQIGVAQSTPIRVAAERIRAGLLDAALIVGGEAKATQQRVARAGAEPPETAQVDDEPDERWAPEGELMAEPEITAGIWDPVAQYACIENALRVAEGLSLDAHLDQVAELWAAFNAVAADNPHAAFRQPRSVEQLRRAGEGNRPLAFPYAKWHSTQWSVDQAGALLLCSAATAEAAGVPRERWVFPHALVDSTDSLSLSRRADLHRWPAMGVLGAAVAEHLGRPLTSIDLVELYSCFPAAVRVQQRELGLPTDGVPTLTGGMAFAGGPFNNFTYQATAAMVGALRAAPGTTGLVSTVSGLLTKPGLAVWSTEPAARPPLVADLGDRARVATRRCEVTGDAYGPATVATYTVTYEGAEPASAFVIGDLQDGRRWVGTTTDAELLARGVGDGPELIGSPVLLRGATCEASRPARR
jgi:acetyl-CoA C-acetyltransferase